MRAGGGSPIHPPRLRGRSAMVVLGLVIVLAGCLPPVRSSLPASFLDNLQVEGQTFTVIAGSDPAAAAPIVEAIPGRWSFWFDATRPEPVLGILTCLDQANGCQPGPAGWLPGASRQVWLILYPDVPVDGDVPWMLVDAATGLENGAIVHDPRDSGSSSVGAASRS